MDRRLTLANILPPVFICTVVGTIWIIYLGLHLMPMLELSGSASASDQALHMKGVWQTVVSQFLTLMFAVCFGRSILGQPGSAPSSPEWMMGAGTAPATATATAAADQSLTTREVKATGDRRYCKWCQTYKPDRCHHCRICRTCVLKMDHHCPWIMNCVGFGNHKFFFLLVGYAVLNCWFIAVTMSTSVQRSVEEETPANTRFLLVLGLVLAILMGVLMSAFMSFHTWLMLKGMTTIEFCEKTLSSGAGACGSKGVSYDLGIYRNLKAVFGPRWWLWCLPLSPPEGNGMNFVSAADLPHEGFYEEPEWTGNEHLVA